jgi:hypothetical protein
VLEKGKSPDRGRKQKSKWYFYAFHALTHYSVEIMPEESIKVYSDFKLYQ